MEQQQHQHLTEQEAADFLRVTRRAVRNWRVLGRGPAYTKAGAKVLYPRRALEAYLKARTVTPGRS